MDRPAPRRGRAIAMQESDAIRSFLAAQRERMLADLRAWVGINTWSRNKAGSDRLQRLIRAAMPPGYILDVFPQSDTGDHYRYRYGGPARRPIVLHGHIDTLCPPDAPCRRMTARGGRLYGPGIHDMKGGLATLVWALRCLDRLGALRRLPLLVIFNADEEIGSPASRRLFLGLADARARLALKFEGAAPGDTLVTTRKGIARFVLTARGRAAHFGNLKQSKRSAIAELGHKIVMIEALDRLGGAVAANVGRIAGGLASNIVAAEATLEFEVRCWDPARMARTLAALRPRLLAPRVPGVRLALRAGAAAPPWRPDAASRRLFRLVCEVGRGMGLALREELRGGISDANWVAAGGTPALDGLGPIGRGDCTPGEHILARSLFERIELAVRLILRLDHEPAI